MALDDGRAGVTPWKCDPPKTTALMQISAVQASDVLVRPSSFMLRTPLKLSLARAAMAESSVNVGQHGIATANGRCIRQMALPIARAQPAA